MLVRQACVGLLLVALVAPAADAGTGRGHGNRGRSERRAVLTGALEVIPLQKLSVVHRINGRVDKVFVKPGDRVHPGQPLLRYREGGVLRRLERSRARFHALLQSAAEDHSDTLAAQLSDAREDLERAEKDAASLTLLATTRGTVERVYAREGRRVGRRTAAFSVIPSEPREREAVLMLKPSRSQLASFRGLTIDPEVRVRVGRERIPATLTRMERRRHGFELRLVLSREPRRDGRASVALTLRPKGASRSEFDDSVPDGPS